MATTPHLSSPTRGVSLEPAPVGNEERKRALADALVAKGELGYEIESQTDFEAVIFTPSPRRWLRTRAGRVNDRLIVTMNDDCRMTTRRRR
jgi:hypothetical protein